MGVARITINASMFAALVRIDGVHHADVGTRHFVHDLLRVLDEHLRFFIRDQRLVESFNMLRHQCLFQKTVLRINLRASAF